MKIVFLQMPAFDKITGQGDFAIWFKNKGFSLDQIAKLEDVIKDDRYHTYRPVVALDDTANIHAYDTHFGNIVLWNSRYWQGCDSTDSNGTSIAPYYIALSVADEFHQSSLEPFDVPVFSQGSMSEFETTGKESTEIAFFRTFFGICNSSEQ